MTTGEWRQVWDLYSRARNLTVEQQQSLIQSVDARIGAEVLALLNQPASSRAAELEFDVPGAAAAASLPQPVQPGSYIGRYLVTGILGHGGMGETFAGKDLDLNRPVALKLLKKQSAESAAGAERSIREAKAASALNHPNIVTVFEVVRSEYGAAIVMELVDGQVLRQLCGSAQPVERVLRIGEQIASGLAAAHAANLVHRDIKPENIMVRGDGYVKILDFGLARQLDAADTFSHANLPAGSLRYMSPEQFSPQKLTPAADIFSMGVVLFELAAGSHPFSGGTGLEVVAAIGGMQQPKKLAEVNPGVPAELASLIGQMLLKNPADRPTAVQVATRLRQLGNDSVPGGKSGAALPAPALAPRRRLIWVGASVVLAAAGLPLVRWRVADRATPSGGLALQQITSTVPENHVTAAAVYPRGGRIAYAEWGGNLLVKDLKTGDVRPFSAPAGVTVDALAWLGEDVLLLSTVPTFEHPSGLWVSSPGGTRPLREQARHGAASPDGHWIAFTSADESEIWIMKSSGEGARKLVIGGETDLFSLLQWAPDGGYLWYARKHRLSDPGVQAELPEDASAYRHSFESVDLTGKLATELPMPVTGACLRASGSMLLLRPEPGRMHDFNVWEAPVSAGALAGPPQRLTNWKDRFINGLTCSQDGKFTGLLVQVSQSDIYVGELSPSSNALKSTRRLTFDDRSEYPHAWTPDSRAVIYERFGAVGWDLFSQRIGDKLAHPISSAGDSEIMAQISADNQWILFASFNENGGPDRLARQRLMRVPLSGGQPQQVPIEQFDEFRCAIIPGHRCVVRAVENRQFVYSELDPLRGRGKELARTAWAPGILGDWALSADGRQAAIPDHNPRAASLQLVDLDPASGAAGPGSKNMPIPGLTGLRGMRAAKGGGWFAAASRPKGVRLLFIDPSGRFFVLHESPVLTWGVPSPDGRYLAFFDQALQSNVWSME